MKVSIIIPSYNTESFIESTLKNLQSQKTQYTYEIIVVDCSESEAVFDITQKHPNTRCVRVEKRFNPGIGRNIGANTAAGELLLFVDADVILNDDVIEKASQHHHNGSKIFGGALELNTAVCNDNAAYLEHYFFNHESQASRPSCERNNLSSAFMCFDKAIFLESGGFKNIPRMQDTELTERLQSQGHTLLFHPDLVALQTQDSPMEKVLKKIYINGQNVYYIRYQKNLTAAKKVIFTITLPAIGFFKTARIIARHLRHQPYKQKIKTLQISHHLIHGGIIWTKGFYQALFSNQGMGSER